MKHVVSELDVNTDIEVVEVKTDSDAKRLRFLGSPTVQVDGEDVEPAAHARTDYGMSCRIYGESGTPPRELIEAALSKGAKEREVSK